ncbi:MAG: hypothetical protein AAFR61_25880 [Bacteroidota bacterium]
MSPGEQQIFQALKQALAEAYVRTFPHANPDIRAWKGQEIVNFQEDLSEKVQGRVSEKWFYTHIKHDQSQNLPRIDVLNMLSRYVGYADWGAFQRAQESPQAIEKAPPSLAAKENKLRQQFPLKLSALVLAVIVLVSMAAFLWPGEKPEATFCIVDAFTRKPLLEVKPEVWWVKADESPVQRNLNKKACFTVPEAPGEIRLMIQAPYYRRDTFVRKLPLQEGTENLLLYPDDYARMLKYFTSENMKDWQKRRAQLQEMFADQARIFQIEAGSELGMEMYNKEEFINLMSLPVSTLKNLEILEVEYKKDQIIRLRFKSGNP